MNQPVIFLDFDGVISPRLQPGERLSPIENLNTRLARSLNEPVLARISNSIVNIVDQHFDSVSCSLLARLQKEFQASIVVTSSWRIFHDTEELAGLLKIKGISGVEDSLPSGGSRAELIRQYLRDNRIIRYIVVDDMNLSKPFSFHFIGCKDGFGVSEFEEARSALRRQS